MRVAVSSLVLTLFVLVSTTANAAAVDYSSALSQLSLSEMRQAALGIWKHGMNPKTYWTDRLETLYRSGGNLEKTLRPQANQAFLRMLRDLQIGSVDPVNVGRDVKLVRRDFLTPKQFQMIALAAGNDAQSFVNLVAPQNAPYIGVQAAMQKIYPHCIDGTWQEIVPLTTPLRLYSIHPVIRQIKSRLALLGYPMNNLDDRFDGDLLKAVTDIQWNMRIRPDGEISPKGKVWSFLSVSCMDRVRQIQVDLEKMRWFPQYFEKKYIFVNLAMSYFIMMDVATEWPRVMSFRTINGRPARKSPTMRDEITNVIINPYWVVPPTIFYEDKVNDLKDLTSEQIREYFDSHHYEAWVGGFRRKVDPTTIDWKGIADGTVDPDIIIRQLPHLGNALGVLKFDLTNSFAIYLHDTNQRELFDTPMRQLSSGCVRLEKPLDLAEYLLEDTPWDRQTIASMMARPGEVVAKPTEIPVPSYKRLPVYTAYLTSMMNSDEVVRFVDDIYGQNNAVLRYLDGRF
ncbi:L,D-transpeptidase family protein [Bdellovibrio bacteriovorus]|uniref:Putative amidase n=1 Tax=Bdellovibrio bacteriovorus str. Tiberius TaxID=1069642 RepID=K7ZGI6_BDEBC|nr:L,D-transpeptidase family protein [Bdellovibrio bacteriovorus]AFY02527.1 putative amidase [Bdellovibrio bacteriovorus str. Tiberius]